MSRLEIALLGPPNIKIDDNPIKTDRRKAIALLAYLTVTNKPQTRDHLAALLWPDYEKDSAYAYLRRTLWELNQILGKGWINADREWVSLELNSEIWLDTNSFLQAVQSESSGANDLIDAIALYRDDFLSGFNVADTAPFEDWQSQQAEYFRREYGTALEKLVDAKSKTEEYETALTYARRWLALDNLNEFTHRAIMHLLAMLGDRTGAIRQYETCQQSLNKELGIPPQPETTELYEAILRGDIKAAPSAHETSISFRKSEPLSHLPVIPTPFIGRRSEVEKIKDLIQSTEHRLITLQGPGGTGKTRLSIQSVSEIADTFPDGVFFIPLAPVQTTDSVLKGMARALGFSFFRGEEDPQQQLLDFLSHKQLLLVLDNFEHMIKASDLVTEILTHAPNVKLVVTSRVRLNVQGEQLYPVSGMSFPNLTEFSSWENQADQAMSFSAVQLFLDRAQRVQPDFVLTEENVQPVLEICQLVEGMPLGIELAAAWLELLPPDEIAKEIIRSLDFLETDQADVPKRQRSIRAVFESSWNLLTDQEQNAFLRLCVFVGSFSREAAQQVSGASLRTLLGLANKSWLQQTHEGRFQLHELMRQYGKDQLKADEPAWREAKTRHADYFASFVAKQSERMRSPDQLTGLEALAEEVDQNVKAAWDWLVSEHRWNVLIEHMALGLFQYSTIRWKSVDLVSWFRSARLAIESSSISEERLAFTIFSTLEIYEEESGQIKDANPIERLGIVWQMVDQYDLSEEMGFWYLVLAGMAQTRNLAQVSDEQITISLSHLRENNTPWQLGISLLILSNWWGVYTLNEDYLVEASKIFESIGVPYEQGVVNELLGRNAFQKRRPHSEVIGHYEQARHFYQQLRGFTYHIFIMSHLVDIYFQQGEGNKGFALFQDEQRELERTGQFRLLEDSQHWEALFAVRYSTFEHTLNLRQSSLNLVQKYGSQSDIAYRKFELGDVYRIFGYPDKALELYDQARPLFENMNMVQALGFDQRARGDLALQDECYAEALDFFQKYFDYATEDNHLWGVAQARSKIALVNAHQGNINQARLDLQSTLSEIMDWRQEDLTLQTLLAEPVCLLEEGKLERAIEVAAFIAHHKVSWNETKQYAREIIESASHGLDEEIVQAAIERGKQETLDSVVAELTKGQK